MSKKVSTVSLVALALLMVLSFGTTFAQSTTPRGGTVMVQQAPAGSWVRNFNPLIPGQPNPGPVNIMYDPLTFYSRLNGEPAALVGDRLHLR